MKYGLLQFGKGPPWIKIILLLLLLLIPYDDKEIKNVSQVIYP